MRGFIKIVSLLFFSVIIVAFDCSSIQQTDYCSVSELSEVEYSESYPSALLTIITSRQSSSSSLVRRISSTSRYNRLSIGLTNLSIPLVLVQGATHYQHIELCTLSLVFKLRNIRI